MAKEKKNSLDFIMIQTPRKLKREFKKVCIENDLSMSKGIRSFMRSAVNGEITFNNDIQKRA